MRRSIPDDHMDPRRAAVFAARSILVKFRDGRQGCWYCCKQAATTPKIRATLQASAVPAWRATERYGISLQTIWT